LVVIDAIQVAGEADHLPFATLVKKGELRTTVKVNGQEVDYLNRHVTSKNETAERLRLRLPAAVLHEGRNVLRIEQSGTAKDPNYLDDLGVLCIALEFETNRPPDRAAEKPGP
jgi:hypothetical protein